MCNEIAPDPKSARANQRWSWASLSQPISSRNLLGSILQPFFTWCDDLRFNFPFPCRAEVFKRAAGELPPQVFVVSTFAHCRVQFVNDVLVVFFRNPVQKIGCDAVAIVVFR